MAQIFQDPTLSGTKFGLKSIPLLAQIHKKVPKSGLLVQLLARSAENQANLVQFFTFYTLPGTKTGKTIPSLAHI